MKSLSSVFVLLLSILIPAMVMGQDPVRNGFVLKDLRIPLNQLKEGGPKKDGIPSIDNPKFVKASEASFMNEAHEVLGLTVNGISRAYPVLIMNWHEVVNDMFGNMPVAVTYCPLCGSGIAFRSEAGGKPTTFGVSGLLYNSDVLLYDRNTESLWSQLMMEAVAGKESGQALEPLSVQHTTWAQWLSVHPDTEVLSTDTGFQRDYTRSPYAGYDLSSRNMFEVTRGNQLFEAKEKVLGVIVNGFAKAYPFSTLQEQGGEVVDVFEGQKINISLDERSQTAYVEGAAPATHLVAYWFAWYAFYPETEIYEP